MTNNEESTKNDYLNNHEILKNINELLKFLVCENDFYQKKPFEYKPKEKTEFMKNFETEIGHPITEACGIYLFGMVYQRDDDHMINKNGEKSLILAPDSEIRRDKYDNAVVKVLDIGNMAFRSRRLGFCPWIKEGMWIHIDRSRGKQLMYGEIPTVWFCDDDVMGIIPDPAKAKVF